MRALQSSESTNDHREHAFGAAISNNITGSHHMTFQHGAYSRHSAVELEALRAPARDAALKEFHTQRVAGQSDQVATLADNIRTLLRELQDLQDDAGREPEKVSYRPLIESLRAIEVNLASAVERLAGELGLIGSVQ
jgi:hypothetical protein